MFSREWRRLRGKVAPVLYLTLSCSLLWFTCDVSLIGVQVETIGDCYIAVAGGPQPCRDHADRAVLLGCSIVKIAKSISKAVGIQLEVLLVRTACRMSLP